jgi:hypothetical protein
MVLAITLLALIREVADPNFGRDTDYHEVLRSIPQSLQKILGVHLEVSNDSFLQHPFQFIIH